MVGAPAKEIALSLKRHLFPPGGRVKIHAQDISNLFFDAAPHLESYFQCFELNTKAAFAKAALTLSESQEHELLSLLPIIYEHNSWKPPICINMPHKGVGHSLSFGAACGTFFP